MSEALRLVLVAMAVIAASSSSAYIVNAEEDDNVPSSSPPPLATSTSSKQEPTAAEDSPIVNTTPVNWECPNITSPSGGNLECTCELAHALRCTGDHMALQALSAQLRHERAGPISLLDITLTGVATLPAGFLADVAIQGLVVSTGELGRVHEAAFASLAEPLQLQALGLPNNLLETVPTAALARLPGLRRLDMQSNKLDTLDATSFKGMTELTYLDLSYNLLARLSPQAFGPLSGLKSLKLRGNRLGVSALAALRGLRNLEELDLSANLLSGPLSPSFLPPMPRLRFLSVAENELKSVQEGALAGLKSLLSLSLSHNQIDVLEDHAFRHLSTLNRLELAFNDIVAVSSASLAHLYKLIHLDVTHNYLRSLSADLVVPLRSLEELRLDENDITMVTNDLPTSKLRLRSLSLTDNPLNCDCSLLEFASWLANSTTNQLSEEDRRSAVCATPPVLENGLLVEVPAGSLLCGETPGRRKTLPHPPPLPKASAQLSLAEFHYDETTGVDLLWHVEPCGQRYTCDTLTVYEAEDNDEEDDEEGDEIQVATSSIHCDSRLMPEPCTLPVSLPVNPALRTGRRYRYCVVLMLPGGYDDLSGHGCSDLIELEDSVHLVAQEAEAEEEPHQKEGDSSIRLETRISGVHVNLSADGCLEVEVTLSGESVRADCAIELDVFAPQSGQVHRKRLNCSSSGSFQASSLTTTRTTLTGLKTGRYRVCANLDDDGNEASAPRNGRARCVEVQTVKRSQQQPKSDGQVGSTTTTATTKTTSTTTTTTTTVLLSLLLLLIVLVVVGLLGLGRGFFLGRAKKETPPQYFMPTQQLEITHKAHYIKLLATTKV